MRIFLPLIAICFAINIVHAQTGPTASRLIATNRIVFDAGGWRPLDSVHMTYSASNIRGYYRKLYNDWDFDIRVKYEYDFTTMGLIHRYQNEQTFNASNELTQVLNKYHDGTTLKDETRETPTYYSNGNLETYTVEQWGMPGWFNTTKQIITWNANNKYDNFVTQKWDGSGSAWINVLKYTPTYDANGNILIELYEKWDGANWVDSERYVNTYTGAHITDILFERYDGISWNNITKYANTIDANGDKAEMIVSQWDGAAWQPTTKTLYTYNANHNETSFETQNYIGGVYEPDYKFLRTYNNYEQELTAQSRAWNSISGQFEPLDINCVDVVHYYEEFPTDVKSIVKSAAPLLIYPVPANNILNVSYERNTMATAMIYDMNGRAVKMSMLLPGSKNTTIDISNLPSGNYTIGITGTKVYKQQFSIAR